MREEQLTGPFVETRGHRVTQLRLPTQSKTPLWVSQCYKQKGAFPSEKVVSVAVGFLRHVKGPLREPLTDEFAVMSLEQARRCLSIRVHQHTPTLPVWALVSVQRTGLWPSRLVNFIIKAQNLDVGSFTDSHHLP